jgi:DNA-directed RNA polymerase subunit K/omega
MAYPFLTKYELARLLGTRAGQIENGAKIMLPNFDSQQPWDPLEIAKQELYAGVIPLSIIRPVPGAPRERIDIVQPCTKRKYSAES